MNVRYATAIIVLGFFLSRAHDILGHRHRDTTPSQRVDRSQADSNEKTVKKRSLVFIGTVTRIYPVASGRSRRNWAVVTEVKRIVSGDFAGATLSFTVHSPARMMLEVGQTYTFEGVWSNGAYLVDDTKLMKPVNAAPRR